MFTDSSMELFNDGWYFKAPGASDFKGVTLPHSWNAEGWSYEDPKPLEPIGIGTYEKHIDGSTYKNCKLKFEGVCAFAEVFINGEKVKENIGAHKAFYVLLDNLNEGDNVITVEVTDKPSLKLLSPDEDDVFTKSPRYELWPIGYGSSLKAGGIWRNVYIQKVQSAYMNPFVLVSDDKGFNVTGDLSGDYKNCKISYLLFDDSFKAEGIIDADSKGFYIGVENPVFSYPLKPHLYTFKADLIDEAGNVIQTMSQVAYMMSFTVRNSEFRVNDKPYYLRGENGFPHCNVPYGRDYIAKYIDMIIEQGVEISRFHTEPPSHEWLDECDRRGVMVILEMPIHGSMCCYPFGHKEYNKNQLSEILSVVKEYRRHPSIAMWSMGNELIVSFERDLGLGKELFDILENWIYEVRKLDNRPVIANSNGDAANITNKTVGDIDDVHQYGGWYVENIYDLRHFGEYTNRNDMLFQPCISTESIAGYTNNNEEFLIKSGDVRQRKIVDMRIGTIHDLQKQSREYQGFLLKEYAEAMWRLRKEGSSFSGYIPFGQYTWFFDAFDKDKIRPKYIWSVYKKVMSPIHVQLECFDRKIERNGYLCGKLGLWNENIHLPENPEFDVLIKNGGKVLDKKHYKVEYHKSVFENLSIGPLNDCETVEFEVYYNNEKVAYNDIDFKIYDPVKEASFYDDCVIFDPENMLDINAKRIDNLFDIFSFSEKTLCVGPYSLDYKTSNAADTVHKWIEEGGRVIVLEQNPGYYSENIFNTGLSSSRVCQPQWSRWAMNLVKHADRADICHKNHRMFDGIAEEDMSWWNHDTFLADSYIYRDEASDDDIVLSHVGNGLSSGELMPIKYKYTDSGFSITAIERKIGKGSIIFSSLLIGTKYKFDPVAKRLLLNLLK